MIKIIVGIMALLVTLNGKAQEKKELIQRYKHQTPHEVVNVKPIRKGIVKNVILLISDGTGASHFQCAEIANGGRLNAVENAQAFGFVNTTSMNRLITDSGAAASAMSTGEKSLYHSIAVDSEEQERVTIVDLAKERGMGTGIVSTVSVTDATPAAFCAHHMDRNQHEDLAAQFLNSNVDIIYGGGRKFFDHRKDGRNLFKEMKKANYKVEFTPVEAFIDKSEKMICLTDSLELRAENRSDLLKRCSMSAINKLSRNEQGFFLMIEGAQSDDFAHANNLALTMQEVLDFDKMVGEVLQWAEENGETLVIVVADHETGGLTLVGGDEKMKEIEGKFSNGGHTGIWVPLFAYGPRSEEFIGLYENSDIFHKVKKVLEIN